MSFWINNIKIENKLVLAPMAGVSNHAFRMIAKKMGAGLVFAEMVSDKGILFNNAKTLDLLYMSNEERPAVQQIFGSDIESMVKAAVFIDKHSNCDIIDINMGCPVPKVALSAQAGASLLKNPDKIYEIVSAICKSVSKPVSVKIRSGWDENSINAVEVAKKIELAGASAITVHARTRSQGYSGYANLDVIKDVKNAVSIPVIGNGDVVDGKSAKHMLEYTGCDAVMIGRAALGNPWIFKEINGYLNNEKVEERNILDIKKLMIEHYEELIRLKGEHIATLEMRSQGPWYLKGLKNASKVRPLMVLANNKNEFIHILDEYFDSLIS